MKIIHGIIGPRSFRKMVRVKYSKKGGFATRQEAEKSYNKYEAEFKDAVRTYQLAHQVNSEVMLKDYLIYWFEEVFSQRVESTTRMVGAYALYDLILPHMEYDIKVKYTNAEYLDICLPVLRKPARRQGIKGGKY